MERRNFLKGLSSLFAGAAALALPSNRAKAIEKIIAEMPEKDKEGRLEEDIRREAERKFEERTFVLHNLRVAKGQDGPIARALRPMRSGEPRAYLLQMQICVPCIVTEEAEKQIMGNRQVEDLDFEYGRPVCRPRFAHPSPYLYLKDIEKVAIAAAEESR